MTIIVTGGAGFIGSNFIFHMLGKYPDYRVICLDKLTYAGNLSTLHSVMDNPNFRFVKLDICDRQGVYQLFEEEKPDVVVFDEDGTQVEVTYDEEARTFTARTEVNTMAEDQQTVALEAAKINCLWMIEEVKDRGKVAKYFDSASKPYKDITTLGELWMQGHAGYEFKNEEVSKFASYGDEIFAVGLRKGSDLKEKLDKFLKDKYADGTLTALAEKYREFDICLRSFQKI